MFAVAGRSSVGAHKSVNQDSWCALVAQTGVGDVALTVVCDGVGGLSSGELASSTVVRAFATWFETEFPSYAAASLSHAPRVDLAGVAEEWARLLAGLNARIAAWGREHDARLGTTFSGMLVCQGRYVIGQVGDCRIYRLRDGEATQLTVDQTLAARAVREGTMTKEEALHMPQGSVLLQSVGTQTELRPEFTYGDVSPGDLYLSCCDGFYRRLGDEGVREAFAAAGTRDEAALLTLVDRLIEQDIARGETDNLTAVCLGVPEDAPVAVPGPAPDDQPTVVVPASAEGPSPDDATTALTGDERTSSLEGGEASWRA